MGERKVLNKYYPPDFDPSKVPRLRNQQMKVRTMLPMSIRCTACGNFLYKGTKFNARKEDVVGETYLGIQTFRFYFKCTKCSAEIIDKTDPKNSDYTVEAGATRNFEPWRSTDEAIDEAKRKKDAEEMGDAMKALENRTMDSKREMDIMSTLDELMSMKARHQALGTEAGLEALKRSTDMKGKELAEEDERISQKVVFHNSANFIRRLEDEFTNGDLVAASKKTKMSRFDYGGSTLSQASETLPSSQGVMKASTFTMPQFIPRLKKKRPEKEQTHISVTSNDLQSKIEKQAPTGLAALCVSYGNGDSD